MLRLLLFLSLGLILLEIIQHVDFLLGVLLEKRVLQGETVLDAKFIEKYLSS